MMGHNLFRNSMFLLVAFTLMGSGYARADMRPIYQLPEVAYPEACMDRQVEGTVVLRFKVNSRGKIENIQVTKEVPACPEFTTAALSAVRHARVFPLPPG